MRALAERSMLLVRRAQMQPHRCPGTPAQYALVRSEAVLSARVAALQHELSDASLQQVGRTVIEGAAIVLGVC